MKLTSRTKLVDRPTVTLGVCWLLAVRGLGREVGEAVEIAEKIDI
ncbi:hypothetical protein [Hyphomicrobium sp. 1Nfss2.1]